MGRLNKKLHKISVKSKTIGEKSGTISKSDVLKTLARKEKHENENNYEIKNNKPPATGKPFYPNSVKQPELPKTLDELETHPEFQLLLLDKDTALQQMLQNTGSSIENKFLKGNEGGVNRIKKKDKMKMRAALLQKKIHVIKLLKEEEKATKKRKRTVVTGDMKPMADTLNEVFKEEIKPLESNFSDVSHTKKIMKKAKGPMKQKKVKASFMEGMSIFNQVNSHQQYKQDPFGTISTHIENKMLIEATSIE